jgi:hypothetical protein
MTTLSVIIPATDRPPTLERVADTIRRAPAAPEELIVVDEPPGLGPAAARNLGARRAKGDILVFVDADVVVHPDGFPRIRRAFESDSDLVALFGSYDDDPEGHGLVSDFRNLLHHHVHQQGAGLATTFWAGLGAIRREAFLRVEGFDDGRFRRPSVEDIDLGMRLVAQGSKIRLDPLLQGKHLKRWTIGTMVRTDLVDRGIPWVRLLLETGSSSTTLNLGWRHRASAGMSVIAAAGLVARRPTVVATATVGLTMLNAHFYHLLWRRRGANQALAAVPLHTLHYLLAAAAVPAALALHLRDRTRG